MPFVCLKVNNIQPKSEILSLHDKPESISFDGHFTLLLIICFNALASFLLTSSPEIKQNQNKISSNKYIKHKLAAGWIGSLGHSLHKLKLVGLLCWSFKAVIMYKPQATYILFSHLLKMELYGGTKVVVMVWLYWLRLWCSRSQVSNWRQRRIPFMCFVLCVWTDTQFAHLTY